MIAQVDSKSCRASHFVSQHDIVLKDIRSWLDPPDSRPRNYERKRRAGSCQWFFDDRFKDWKACEKGLYWVYGNGTPHSLSGRYTTDSSPKPVLGKVF